MYKWTKLFSHKIIKTSKSEKSAFGWLCPPMSPHVPPSSVHPQMDSDSPWLSSSIVTSWRRSQSSRRRESSPLLSWFLLNQNLLLSLRDDAFTARSESTPPAGSWRRRTELQSGGDSELLSVKSGSEIQEMRLVTAASLRSILWGPAHTHISYAAMKVTSANPASRRNASLLRMRTKRTKDVHFAFKEALKLKKYIILFFCYCLEMHSVSLLSFN